MRTDNLILLDTNVLVYGQEKQSEFFQRSRAVIEQGFEGALSLCICPQVLMEFHSTVTNPKRVTKPVSVDESLIEIEKYLSSKNIRKIYPVKHTLSEALRLISSYQIKKQEVYDTQLVATMLTNDVTQIYTFNVDHFRQFKEIEVFTP
jgi:predicted nucleic acid-binding protein